MLAIFAAGASEGMTISAGASWARAASATPCAWLPELKAITPRRRAFFASAEIADQAPRNLKLPVCCRHSGFTSTCRPAISLRKGEERMGVRRALPASRSSAARIIA